MTPIRGLLACISALILARWPALLRRVVKRRMMRQGLHPLSDQPIISPGDYQKTFIRWNSLALDIDQARDIARRELATGPTRPDGLSFGLSTGTMGEPGVFITSAADRARYLGLFLARVLPMDLIWGSKAAVLLRNDSALYHAAEGRVLFLSLAEAPEAIAEKLVKAAPDIVIGPPSSLRRILETACLERHPISARLVITGGEPLWPDDAEALRQGFGAEVRQVYQAAEGFIGASCGHGRLHLNADIVHVEAARFPKGTKRLVPIITDIGRSGHQRLTRLRMDDVAIEAEGACPCGSALPSIKAIEGRLSDVLVFGSTDDPQFLFPFDVDRVVRSALSPGIRYRIVQDALDGLTVHLPKEAVSQFGDLGDQLKLMVEREGAELQEIRMRPLQVGPISEKVRRISRRCMTDNAPCLKSLRFPRQPLSEERS